MIVAAQCSTVEEPSSSVGFQLMYVKQNLVVVLYLKSNLVRMLCLASSGAPDASKVRLVCDECLVS